MDLLDDTFQHEEEGNLTFSDAKGETLIKEPGTINGSCFALKNLVDCTIYLLDYTSEVEVTNTTNCKIFIGPVDGPVIFDSCDGCQVSSASQQFQAKTCSNCSFSLYCATSPSLSGCSSIKILPWNGSYPMLASHFASANLDPFANAWKRVYDAQQEEGAEPNFEIITDSEMWQVPLEGLGEPENPVPRPKEESITKGEEEVTFTSTITDESSHPVLTEAAAATQRRIAEQTKTEAENKSKMQRAAAAYLEKFYRDRSSAKESRAKQLREESEALQYRVTDRKEGSWEDAIKMIDFNKSSADLSRFKSILLSLNKN